LFFPLTFPPQYIDDEVRKQSVRIGLTITSMIFVAAGVYQIVETFDSDVELDFFTSLWFIVVTITTVGYGDIAPRTSVGRVVVIFIIIFAIFAIPLETNRLLELLAK